MIRRITTIATLTMCERDGSRRMTARFKTHDRYTVIPAYPRLNRSSGARSLSKSNKSSAAMPPIPRRQAKSPLVPRRVYSLFLRELTLSSGFRGAFGEVLNPVGRLAVVLV